MLSVINHNIPSLTLRRHLGVNSRAAEKSAARLSSGLKVNSAADDAAGLAISEKMRGQIRGLNQAVKNSLDGQNFFRVGESALQEINNILNRTRELAIQAINDTNTDEDRKELNSEIQELFREITRIANTTEFNTQKIFTSEKLWNEYSVTRKHDMYNVYFTGGSTRLEDMPLTGYTTTAADSNGFFITDTHTNQNLTTVFFDVGFELSNAWTTLKPAGDSRTFDQFVVGMAALAPGPGLPPDAQLLGEISLFTQVFGQAINNGLHFGVPNIYYPNDGGIQSQPGLPPDVYKLRAAAYYEETTGRFGLGFLDSQDYKITFRSCTPALGNSWGHGFVHSWFTPTNEGGEANITETENTERVVFPPKRLYIQTGANTMQGGLFAWDTISIEQLGLSDIDISTRDGAEAALGTYAKDVYGAPLIDETAADQPRVFSRPIDRAAAYINRIRSTLGAYINRLDYAIDVARQTGENVTAAEARIRDTDMAAEISKFIRENIKSQAAQAIMTQANALSQQVLSLLQ
jgi:flagellin